MSAPRTPLLLCGLEDRTAPVAGALDPAFGGDGIVNFSLPGFYTIKALNAFEQPDGKTVLVGTADSPDRWQAAVYRLNPDRSLDSTFSGDGVAAISFASYGGNSWGHFYDGALQPDGKIVCSGTAFIGGNAQAMVARFNSDGTLDPSFGTNGYTLTDLTPRDENGFSMALQADGKIVVCGNILSDSDNGFLFLRYTADGVLDTTFNGTGYVKYNPGSVGGIGRSVVVQPDGKIVGFGASSAGGQPIWGFTMIRLNPDGSFDSSFDGDGIATAVFPQSNLCDCYSLALMPDGRLVGGGDIAINSMGQFAFVRFNPDGTPDTTFDGDGRVYYQITAGGVEGGAIQGLVVQPDNKIVGVGYAAVPGGGPAVIMRLNEDGSLDQTFGPADKTIVPGVVATSACYSEQFWGVTMLADGKLLAVGEANGKVLAARYVNDTLAANPDQYSTPEDTPLSVGAPGVMANDTLPLSGTTEAVLVNGPTNAAGFTLNPDGSFEYTPAANFNGQDSFTYSLVSGNQTSNVAAVTINVTPVNDPPVAVGEAYPLPLDSPFTTPTGSLLANDSDIDGDPLTAVLVDPPPVGALTLKPDGSFSYDFPADLVGPVSFTYQASDGQLLSNVATVTLTREAIVDVRGSVLHIIGTDGADTVHLSRAAKGAIAVELVTPSGPIVKTLSPIGSKRFTLINVLLGGGDDQLDAAQVPVATRVVGGGGSDVIRTGKAADQIFADETDGSGDGDNVVDAGSGNNFVLAGDGNNTIVTGRNADTVTAGNGRNAIVTGRGNDVVKAGTGGSLIDVGAGNDSVEAAGGSNFILGGAGRDVLQGGTGADVIDGGAGNDLIVGGLGADRINGGAGNDILFDGLVTVKDTAVDTLAGLLATYVPSRRSSLVNISDRIVVTFDAAAADMLLGGPGTDWFWTNDLLDLTDRGPKEPLGPVH